MPTKPAAFVLMLLTLKAWGGEPAAIEFQGVLISDGRPRILLTHPDTQSRAWVGLGQRFCNYVFSNYDAATETATLIGSSEKLQLRLRAGRIQPAMSPELIAQVRRAILNNLRQIAAAADQFYLENGVMRTSLDKLVGPGRYIRDLRPVDGENYQQLILAQGQELRLTTASGITVTYAP